MNKNLARVLTSSIAATLGILVSMSGTVSYASTSTSSSQSVQSNTASDNPSSILVQTTTPKLDHIEHYADGGSGYVYYVAGNKFVFPVPPKNFNPLTADSTTLNRYGFPSRPSDPSGLKDWTDVMSHYKTTPIPKLGIPLSKSFGYTHAHEANVGNTSSQTFGEGPGIWSGYEALASQSSFNEFTAVQGNFVQPYAGSTALTPAGMGSWVGLGGDHTHKLLQLGTMMDSYNNDSAWYELFWTENGQSYNTPPEPINSVSIYPGDNIHLYVQYSTSTDQVNFFIANETTGVSQPIVGNVGLNYYDGSSAEWIDETHNQYLVNFGQVNWNTAEDYSVYGYWNGVGSLSNVKDYIVYNSDLLASPDAISSSTPSQFTDRFYAQQ